MFLWYFKSFDFHSTTFTMSGVLFNFLVINLAVFFKHPVFNYVFQNVYFILYIDLKLNIIQNRQVILPFCIFGLDVFFKGNYLFYIFIFFRKKNILVISFDITKKCRTFSLYKYKSFQIFYIFLFNKIFLNNKLYCKY